VGSGLYLAEKIQINRYGAKAVNGLTRLWGDLVRFVYQCMCILDSLGSL
jgi:hypothetical protein